MKSKGVVCGWLAACLTWGVCSTCCSAVARSAESIDTRNLIANGGFEQDQDNLRAEKMSCPVQPRVTYGQSDGYADSWTNAQQVATLVRDKHSGEYALALKTVPHANPPVALSQTFTYAAQTTAGPALPELRGSAWIKASGAASGLHVELILQAMVKDPKTNQGQPTPCVTVNKDFPATANWTQVFFDLSAQEIQKAFSDKPQPLGLVTGSLSLAPTAGSASVLVDDVQLLCPSATAPYTLVANAGFESLGKDGQPADWSRAKKALRYFGSNYYIWRDWYHFFGEPRGTNSIDRLMTRSGKQSFRMNVPPGDHKYIESAAIPLNQTQPRRMILQFDYNSHLLANLYVQVVDSDGKEVFAQNVVPGSSQGWRTFQAEFLPRKAVRKAGDIRNGSDLFGATGDALPIKACRVRIGVKGVNGSEMDDINQWVNVNHAGALWIDNVALLETESTAAELAARGAKTYPLADSAPALAAEAIDLGERLFGDNTATVTLVNHGSQPAAGTLTLTLSGPFKETDPKKSGYAMGAVHQDQAEPALEKLKDQVFAVPYSVPANGRAAVKLPYTISQLLPDWRSEYRVHLSLDKQRSLEIPLGTWSQQALVEVEKCYAFPEDKVEPVFMNLGVAQKSLAKVDRLHLEIRRARDGKVVATQDQPNFQTAAARFNVEPLPAGFEGDNTNFLLTEISIGQLPIHPQTEPVRDYVVFVSGIDKAGKVVFEGSSPRFGRMEAHNEKLEPISSVSIHKNNYLLINNKPFFSRGHLWMQQNFGPSPLARKNTEWKKYGFNLRAGVQSPLQERNTADPQFGAGVDDLWSIHNTYVGSQMIAARGPMTAAVQADIHKWLSKPNIIGIHFVPWEGAPQGPVQSDLEYTQAVKSMIGTRPLWISAGWYAPRVNGRMEPCMIEHDWFAPENNAYFQPSQLDKEVLPLKQGKPCVLTTYPNVFNDTPWLVQRFEHWTEIIRHHTGMMQIGKPGDPTLMAGMNGELRFIESFLFSEDKTPEVAASPNVEHLVRSTAKANFILATNAGPTIGGDWQWNDKLKDKGRASHTGTALWSRFHDYMKDYYSHFYKDDRPVTVHNGDAVVQYVYIPAGAKVENLVLMVRGNGEWRYQATWGNFNHQAFTDSGVRLWMAKDMHQMSWGSINLGFCGAEGHDIHNPALLKYTFTADQFHNLGGLPAAGAWARLEVPVEKLGLEGKLVDGFAFVSKGDKIAWERTLLKQGDKEITLCDGAAGIAPAELKSVRFAVAGLKAGTKVKVCFEERDITAKDGYFEDDLSGDPGYRNLWVGIYGDKLGETGYYGDGVMYNYNWGKVAARLYELPK